MTTSTSLDIAAIKADFPLLAREVHGRPIVFLDSAASSQKPRVVIDAMTTYYETINANVHRGVYQIAEEATNAMEAARRRVAAFIGARTADEVVFTKNATEALNLVAQSWGRANLGPGDAVVLTQMEHHANIVPWHMMAAEKGFEVRFLPVGPDGHLDLADHRSDPRRRPNAERHRDVERARDDPRSRPGSPPRPARSTPSSPIDACQYVPHLPTDVAALDADFLAFSGHKMCGPTGIGVLWGREKHCSTRCLRSSAAAA